MANYNYSFQNPMRIYKNYTSELTAIELNSFQQKYSRRLSFKQSTFWIASKTGFNKSDVDPNASSLCISDAIGRVYDFPYKLQNELFLRFDSSDSLGLHSKIKAGKPVEPFNWRQITISNSIIGYTLNMISSIPSCDWGKEELKSYFMLCDKILEGSICAVFYPYYLAPNFMKPAIKHSLLATRSVFGIGVAALYSTDGSLNVDSNMILALIPDIDFITLFDLTAFSGLGFGQMYKDYNTLMQTNERFASSHLKIDSPKPKDLPIKNKMDSVPTSVSFNDVVNTSNQKTSMDYIEEKVKKDREKVENLNKILVNIKNQLLNDKSVYSPIIDRIDIYDALGNSILLNISLYSISPNIKTYCPVKLVNELQQKNGMLLYKTKEKQKMYFNIVLTLNENQFDYITTCGLYGDSKLSIELDSGILSEKNLHPKNVNDFLTTFMSEDIYNQIVNNGFTFDELVFKGLYEGFNDIKNSTTLENIGDYNIELVTINETEDSYLLNFDDDCVFKELEIKNSSESDLEYKLVIDVERFGYEPESLSSIYVGNESIDEAVKSLVIEAFNSLS